MTTRINNSTTDSGLQTAALFQKHQAFSQSKKFTADLNMNSIARIARTSATMAKRANVARTFVSTPKALGGAKHDAHAHGDGHGDGHDDHEHHDHPVRRI